MRSRTVCEILSLLLCAGAAGAATTEQSNAIPHTFCVSERATNGRVYLTPVFQDPLRDVRDDFAGYLANAHQYRGGVECFTLSTRDLADQFRTQRIAIAHWNHVPHIVATQWVPRPDELAPRSEVAAREAASGPESAST